MAEKRFEYRYATEDELEEMKQKEFTGWMFTYVSAGLARGETFDDWIREMVVGPNFVVKSYPRFCTRGYAFTTQKRRRSSTTYDAGVCSASGDDVYFEHILDFQNLMFNRSGNGISAWINRMMYSALDRGHPTFTHFPTDKQVLWFRQFAQEFNWNSDETLFIYHHFVHKVMDNYGK
uniref:Uncharacterized protein n=1 Tax=Brassica oleracea var. oleracea TaxID=109376 RepID=A0A0D3BU73_BRAOL